MFSKSPILGVQNDPLDMDNELFRNPLESMYLHPIPCCLPPLNSAEGSVPPFSLGGVPALPTIPSYEQQEPLFPNDCPSLDQLSYPLPDLDPTENSNPSTSTTTRSELLVVEGVFVPDDEHSYFNTYAMPDLSTRSDDVIYFRRQVIVCRRRYKKCGEFTRAKLREMAAKREKRSTSRSFIQW